MYTYYPDELIEEIRLNNDIVDVVSEYVKLERKAKYYFGLCPFHKEKTPSFSVTPSKQIFYCYGCGKGGNVIQFIMNAENLDYIEAVRFLADRARIQLPEGNDQEELEKARLRQKILDVNKEAAKYFHERLKSKHGEQARLYFENRGITNKTLIHFGLGYSPDSGDQLFQYLIKNGYDEKVIVESGLAVKSRNGNCIDRFRGRVIFPIFDVRGNVIAFGGRVKDSSMPKYLNSPESLAYNKGRHLYALNFAKNSGEKRLIIVEGYLDVISLHQNGIINSVASLGTALTENQGRLLKKYAEEVIISYDSDTAGQAATIRGLDLLNNMGCSVKVLEIPEGKDPDEFIRKNGPEQFLKLADRSVSLVEYKIKMLKKQLDTNTTEGKIKFISKIAEILAKINNRVEIEVYINKLSKDYEISEESIYSEVFKKSKPKKDFRSINSDAVSRRISIQNDEKGKTEEEYHDELMLLALVCVDNNVYKLVKDGISLEDIADNEIRNVARYVFERLDTKKGIIPAELLNMFDSSISNRFASILEKECNIDDNGKAIIDIIKRIKARKFEKRKQEILMLMGNKDNIDKGVVEKLTIELNQLILKLKNL
jgi:DNA primase